MSVVSHSATNVTIQRSSVIARENHSIGLDTGKGNIVADCQGLWRDFANQQQNRSHDEQIDQFFLRQTGA